MAKFMIGQYGSFDKAKYERDFRDGFYGIEACLLQEQADVDALRRASRERGFRIGIHFPLRAGQAPLRDALFLSPDERMREWAYALIESELDYTADLEPAYMLFHYPKPVLLDSRIQLNNWKFDDKAEYMSESEMSLEKLEAVTDTLFRWLTDKAAQFRFTPVLEFDFVCRAMYETEYLTKLLDRYPAVRLCLDTGRLHLQDKLDPYFDAEAVIMKYACYADMIHLSTMQVDSGVRHRHYPALPHLRPEEGWAPIERYLSLIKDQVRAEELAVMFEHRSDYISDEELEQCYEWIRVMI